MVRVAGTDPGTTSLDLLVLEDGEVADQCRFSPEELRTDPARPVAWLREQGPFDLIAGPSGYGLPLVAAADCFERDLALMTLVRPADRGHDHGVPGFRSLLRTFLTSALPVVFLPGVLHLPSVPSHRKINRIDMGTADKLCVAALALERLAAAEGECRRCHACVVELGSAFTSCLVIENGQVVDGVGGTCGPVGWRSGGAWDGETAYLLSPLSKSDLFRGGVTSLPDPAEGRLLFRESLVKAVAGLRACSPFSRLVLSGRLLETEPEFCRTVQEDLTRFGSVERLQSLPGAWVKHAAQGSALLADGLAGGRWAPLVESLQLRAATGSVLDWLHHPRAATVLTAIGWPAQSTPG